MKRTIYFLLSSLLISSAALAQNTSIVIGTNPSTSNGPQYIVDGTGYIKNQVFVWPVGSVHVVQFPFSLDNNGNGLPYQSQLNDTIRFTFGGWVASSPDFVGGNSPIVTVTADPSMTSLIGTVAEEVQVNINFGGTTLNPICAGAPGNAPAAGAYPGIIYLSGGCIGSSQTLYAPIGAVILNAIPYPGWVFTSWNMGNGTYITSPYISYNIAAPMTITPQFTIAKVVNFLTQPLGLQVMVDGASINTPTTGQAANGSGGCTPDYTRLSGTAPAGFPALCIGEFDFAPGSTHTIGAPSPQLDNAQGTWVFENFNNGLTQNATYVAPTNTQVQDTLIADFVPGVHVSLYTIPQGLKLMIDGRDNWPGNTFIWGQGEVHQVNAESPQTDSKGHVWTYSSWSDGGSQAHAVTVPAASGLILGASYGEFPQITFASSPTGLTFTVDGATCTTPCVFSRPTGSTSTVVAPSSVPFNTGSRYDFLNWADGVTTTTRTVAYSQTSQIITANYQTSYQLTTAALPSGAGTFQINPTSPDGYYAQGTQVSVAAVANSGYKFAHWTGSLSGSINSGSVQMNGPQSVTADYATVPVITPAGIESATGPTPNGTVAAGSLITIYGQNLAPATVVGPSNPLAQTIGGTTVKVGSFIMPLVYVSPTLVSAQVPWELPPGAYSLSVNTQGQAPVTGQFTVARDAPGVFTQTNPQQQPLVLALHANGSLISFSSPATQGEQITIYGTGFGPYDQPAIDGFPAASTPAINLVDSLVLASESGPIPVDWAGAAPGIVGVAEVKVTVGNGMPSGANMNLTITINGVASMPFVLPLQ
jgi:uncharacterized protein (TIGR03437 family)